MSFLRLTIVAVILGCTTLLALNLLTNAEVVDQRQDRVLKKKDWSNEPIAITKVKVKGGKAIGFGENHSGDDDWFRGLTVDVKNISKQTIVFVDLVIAFPPTEGSPLERAASDHLLYGNFPALPGETSTPHPDQPALQPGDTATLRLADYEGTRDFLNKVGKPQSIKEIEISILDVFFDDGTKYSGGHIWKRDPNSPTIWIPASREVALLKGKKKSGKTAVFVKADFSSPSYPPVPPQDPGILQPDPQVCYSILWSEDKFCGSNTRCAVRHDHPTSQPLLAPTYKYKSVDDRCVNRDTHQACSTFLFTTFKDKLCDVFEEASSCQLLGYFWNYTNSTCNTTSQGCPGFCEEPGGIDLDLCQYQFGCPQGFQAGNSRTGQCCFPAPCPVVVDVDGSGFQFTNAIEGVNFDIDGDGDLDPISWTSRSSTNAWLVLDRNGNGLIDNGRELFGNVTTQAVHAGAEPNGFLALAKYDGPADGGNGDGVISSGDAIFSSLKLWQDINHNGISETEELHPLSTWGITALELDYKESKRTDADGNHFRYRAKVKNAQGQQLGRWAWDVYLLRR